MQDGKPVTSEDIPALLDRLCRSVEGIERQLKTLVERNDPLDPSNAVTQNDMADSAPSSRTPKDFAEERSHRDAVVSSETNRAAAQVAILINGGAATAILAFLAKDKLDPFVLRWLPWCLIGYGVGVFFGSFDDIFGG